MSGGKWSERTFASVLCGVLLWTSSPVFGESIFDLSVNRLFVEGASTGGFYPLQGISTHCAWNLIYVDLSSAAGRSQFAQLMLAKAQGLRLQRVDFVKNSGGTCSLSALHIE